MAKGVLFSAQELRFINFGHVTSQQDGGRDVTHANYSLLETGVGLRQFNLVSCLCRALFSNGGRQFIDGVLASGDGLGLFAGGILA